jgi:biopolymer transport protein ExbD
MPKIKQPAKSPHIDMTPMVDLFSLLLTFFMLTTSFIPQEAAVVDTPSSISEKQAPGNDIMTIIVDSVGRTFFNIDNGKDTTKHVRAEVLQDMGAKYNIKFTIKELADFSKLGSFGTHLDSIKLWINTTTSSARQKYQTGLPLYDSTNNEFKYWIYYARLRNSEAEVAIKADGNTNYKKVKKIIDILQENKVNKFNLVTNLQKQEVTLKDIPKDVPK